MKASIGDIFKFRTGEVGMIISEKPNYYSVLCDDGKIKSVRKGIPFTFIDLESETANIYREYKDYLFEKESVLKRIEIENDKLFQINNILTDIQLKLRLKGSKYRIDEFIEKVTSSLNSDLLKELNEKCSVDMTYQSGCFRVEIYQEKCVSDIVDYYDIVVPETIGGSETGDWVLNTSEFNISDVCAEVYIGKDIMKFNKSVNMQNVMVSEEKDIFVFEEKGYFYNSTVYRFRASKLTDDLIDIIKNTITKN